MSEPGRARASVRHGRPETREALAWNVERIALLRQSACGQDLRQAWQALDELLPVAQDWEQSRTQHQEQLRKHQTQGVQPYLSRAEKLRTRVKEMALTAADSASLAMLLLLIPARPLPNGAMELMGPEEERLAYLPLSHPLTQPLADHQEALGRARQAWTEQAQQEAWHLLFGHPYHPPDAQDQRQTDSNIQAEPAPQPSPGAVAEPDETHTNISEQVDPRPSPAAPAEEAKREPAQASAPRPGLQVSVAEPSRFEQLRAEIDAALPDYEIHDALEDRMVFVALDAQSSELEGVMLLRFPNLDTAYISWLGGTDAARAQLLARAVNQAEVEALPYLYAYAPLEHREWWQAQGWSWTALSATHGEPHLMRSRPVEEVAPPDGTVIRAMNEEDLADVHQLDLEVTTMFDTPQAMKVSIQQQAGWVALDGERLVAALYMRPLRQDALELLNLIVHPEYQSQGIGTLLMTTLEAQAREQGKKMLITSSSQLWPTAEIKRHPIQFMLRLGWYMRLTTTNTCQYWKDLGVSGWPAEEG